VLSRARALLAKSLAGSPRWRDLVDDDQTRLVGGRTIVHVLSDSDPGAGFTAVDGGLEDVYFATLSTMRRAAPLAA
jgi:hypothetical protein